MFAVSLAQAHDLKNDASKKQPQVNEGKLEFL